MANLIDKDALVAEIEKRIEEYKNMKIDSSYYEGMVASLEFFRDEFINTLEVKEVNLEKEVIDWWNAHYSSKAYTFEGYSGHYIENSTLIEIAKHFFELGLKTQKG